MSDTITRLNAALEGRYRIERQLGEGGMATVYLADDLKHERKVALKVLKPELAAVVGAERFLAEIKTTANLQHPHILPLFDSGEADSFLFYVMPFVEGETLRDGLDREKQLPIDEAVRIATEVAEALEYAHGRAVVHRDIKPANILLQGGRVLVADFGIALAVSHAGAKRLTETGLSVGTPQYMSPEQAAGDRELDGRSDLYSLACITYEMLAGDPPYTASTAQAILAKILTEEAKPLSQVRRRVPSHVESAVHTALQKLPADRFGDATEFAGALTGAHAFPAGRVHRVGSGAARDTAPFGLTMPNKRTGALLAITLAAVAWLGYMVGSAAGPATAAPAVTTRITFDEIAGIPGLSPDGTQLAYVVSECPPDLACRGQIMVQDLVGGGDPVPSGPTVRTERGESGPTSLTSIEWSPDGQRILFTALYAEEPSRSGIYSMPRSGGTPTMIAAGRISGGAFRPTDDAVNWIEGPTAARVIGSRLPTGDMETHPLASEAAYLDWSPDGRWLALIGHQEFGANISGPELMLVGPDWQVTDRLQINWERGEDWLRVRWNAAGDAVYTLLGGDLIKVAVDPEAGLFVGAPEVVILGLEPKGIAGRGQFDVSRDGTTLVYTRTSQRVELRALEVTPEGLRRTTLAAGTTTRDHPALSPNGELVAYTREDPLGTNLYLREFAGGREWALTATPGHKTHPRWSSDGAQLAYVGHEPDGAWLFTTVPVAGGQVFRRGRVSAGRFPPYAWFPGEERILVLGETGILSILMLQGSESAVEPLFLLPGEGPLWGLLVQPGGDSLAAFNFSLGADGIASLWVDIGSMTSQAPDWQTVFREDWATFDRTAYEADIALSEWRWQTPQAWEGDRLIISQSRRPGNRAFGGLWALPIGGDEPTQLFDLGDHCGAPSYVTMDASGRRLVCVYREMSSDVWRIENFDPDASGG